MTASPPPSYSRLIAAIIVASLVIAAGILGASYLGPARTQTLTITQTQTPSISSSSCYYVLPQAVPCLIGQNFTLSVNYTGQWEVAYQGYNCGGKDCGVATTTGRFNGTGFNSGIITVEGAANGWTLCAQAQKLDDSSSILVLKIAGAENSTVLSFGSTSECVESQLA